MEVVSLFFLAFDEGYVTENGVTVLLLDIEKLAKGIAGANRSPGVAGSKTRFRR